MSTFLHVILSVLAALGISQAVLLLTGISITFFLNNSKIEEFLEEKKKEEEEEEVEKKAEKKEVKFEDKYLDRIRAIPNEILFTEDELKSQENLFPEFLKRAQNATSAKINEDDIREEVQNHIFQKRFDHLKHNFVMELTPLGNVVMYYNNQKEAFDYYADNVIPYRFLEVVCRKYVLTYNCRALYVDMQEELKKAEEKKKQEQEKEREKEEQEKENKNVAPPKKSVFAKLKSYNKDATGHVNKAVPPKNNMNSVSTKESSKSVLLKAKANMYSNMGRFSNFNFLQKVDKKLVDKKQKMTFADFKKLQQRNL
jgi:hypothetical protein